jgi:Biopolymer transport protein ExbD/TolR
MAETTPCGGSAGRPGPPRAQKMSVRIDFTPMVDLGFLLITFFMLATTLAKPSVMALVLPRDDGETRDPIPESKVLTLLLGGNDRVYWYEGVTAPVLDSVGYGPDGIRRVILDKMETVNARWGLEQYRDGKTGAEKTGSYLTVLIKPGKDARFKNYVDALDEMHICGVRYYMPLDMSEQEAAFIRNPTLYPPL